MINHFQNLEQVSLFNQLAYGEPTADNMTDTLKRTVELCIHEVEELEQNIIDNNPDGMRDDFCDILYVLYGILYRGDMAALAHELWQRSHLLSAPTTERIDVAQTVRNGLELFLAGLDYGYHNPAIICDLIGKVSSNAPFWGNTTLESDFAIVCTANLNKFDSNIEDAKLTVTAYAQKGIATYFNTVITDDGKEYHICHSAKDQVVEGKSYPLDKVLKSHLWQEPVFD